MTRDEAYELLASGFDDGRSAHGYLLCGDVRGQGVPLAERIMQRLLCREPDAPCGQCRDCERVLNRRHPDTVWIEPQMKSRRISVKQIRALQRRVAQTSFEGGWKCCAIVAADCMGGEGANAFLKTLEEPPGRTLFLLLTDRPQFLLPTVISRCQRILLPADSVPGVDWEPMAAVLEVLADFDSDGSVDAYRVADQLAAILKALKAEAEADVAAEATAAAEAETEDADKDTTSARASARYREQRRRLMCGLEAWYRDVLVGCVEGGSVPFHFESYRDVIMAKSARLSGSEALDCLRGVDQMHTRMERNMSEATVLSSGFARMPC